MSIDLTNVKKVDLMISRFVCVCFKSLISVKFHSQIRVLCFIYSSSIVFIRLLDDDPFHVS